MRILHLHVKIEKKPDDEGPVFILKENIIMINCFKVLVFVYLENRERSKLSWVRVIIHVSLWEGDMCCETLLS